jgi:hypothetical protein
VEPNAANLWIRRITVTSRPQVFRRIEMYDAILKRSSNCSMYRTVCVRQPRLIPFLFLILCDFRLPRIPGRCQAQFRTLLVDGLALNKTPIRFSRLSALPVVSGNFQISIPAALAHCGTDLPKLIFWGFLCVLRQHTVPLHCLLLTQIFPIILVRSHSHGRFVA